MAVSTQNCFPYRFGFSSQRRLINAAPQSYSVIEKTFFFFLKMTAVIDAVIKTL